MTPYAVIWETTGQEVIIPGENGKLGILDSHAPLLTHLASAGVLRIRNEEGWKSIALMGGFAEVNKNKITVLAHSAQRGEQININEAKSAVQEALAKLNDTQKIEDKQIAANLLRQAETRLQAALNEV
uniref:ATP synthase CF1 epsilon subunit n=1 Tax=Gloeochaete wittrockiana TaxID=38269 RepID=A0A3G1IWF8_9EUKA|nr:ATP synthase CF1 epsilon subunit [Gloeochaete wittrockiana]ASQ40279.1 ATP synthase CF1 epsilon subunit [Gloeochaete wittrockiana]